MLCLAMTVVWRDNPLLPGQDNGKVSLWKLSTNVFMLVSRRYDFKEDRYVSSANYGRLTCEDVVRGRGVLLMSFQEDFQGFCICVVGVATRMPSTRHCR